MADTDDSPDETDLKAKKGLGKLGWILTILIALALGGGGFYVTFSGLLGGEKSEVATLSHSDGGHSNPAPIFLELDPMTISVGDANSIRQLRFRAFLELPVGHADVASLQPRILDIFATYLRAVSIERLENPTALLHLRAQLLRRVQLLAGADSVSDLLIIDFVIT